LKSYDVITVGGGLGGSSLARSLAERGLSVLVLEREKEFRDRVRGEQMHPWGVAEAKSLGIHELLSTTCGHDLPWWDLTLAGNRMARRDLTATTLQRAPELSFYHPAMQEVLIQAASDASRPDGDRTAESGRRRSGYPPIPSAVKNATTESSSWLSLSTRWWSRFRIDSKPSTLLSSSTSGR